MSKTPDAPATPTPSPTDRVKHANLREALVACSADIRNVPKTGVNKNFNYKYATDADVTGACRPAMLKHGVLLTPIGVDLASEAAVPTQKGTTNYFHGIFVYRVSHADSDEFLDIRIPAGGQDANEKGPYKAATGAKKYALLQLFCIDTGDDPEKDINQTSGGGSSASDHASDDEIREYAERVEQVTALKFTRCTPKVHEVLKLEAPVRSVTVLSSDQLDAVIADFKKRPTKTHETDFNRLVAQDLCLKDEQVENFLKVTYKAAGFQYLTGFQAVDLLKLLGEVAANKAPLPEAFNL